MAADVTPVVAALKKSGFPLQTRVRHEVSALGQMGWKVLASEYPWRDPEGRDQFIDLIACCGCVVLVIECKKASERSLLFLRPQDTENIESVKSFVLWHVEQPQNSTDLLDIPMQPASHRAEFCVSSDTSNQRLLEQDARHVLLAADAVVEQFPRTKLSSRSFVAPVIVTTASLHTGSEATVDIRVPAARHPSRIGSDLS